MEVSTGVDPSLRTILEDIDARLRKLEQSSVIDMKGRQIVNVSVGVKPTDAATFGQVKAMFDKLKKEIDNKLETLKRRT